MVYDPQATAQIPIRRSLGMWIWWSNIPATPIEGTPEFINHSPPDGLVPHSTDLLIRAGCEVPYTYMVECPADSPLAKYDCTEITSPENIYVLAQEDPALVGACQTETDDFELTPGQGITMSGCAFKRTVGYFFQIDEEIVLIDNPEDLQKAFAPIESESEAISYAQLSTGLYARFDLSFNPYLLYLQDTIEDTHVTQVNDGYRLTLYHFPYCSCEPYVNSVVTLLISHDGTVTWENAVPFSLTTGYSCAD